MQLREIHIVSFGVLANVRVRGLVPGLNVLHGPNEFGKTSLLEFARRVLFGFPNKTTKSNQYLLPHSDKNSGQLVCELGDGRTLNVSRSTGTRGGPLTVTTSDGASLSDADFAAALDHVSSDLYQNVFSVGLQELYEVDVANLDDVKDRIYGAGLGGVNIPELRTHFEKRANDLFTKGGHKQVMKELAAEIILRGKTIRDERTRLAQYDEKQSEHDRLKEKAEELGTDVRTMQAQQRSLESQERLYPTFLDMQRAGNQLAEMGEVPDVPDEALVELQDRRTTLKTLAGQLEGKQEESRLKEAALDRISYDQSLLRHEDDIRSLVQSVASYRSTGEELPVARRDMQDAQEQVEQKLSTLGEGWTTEKVRSFTLTTAQLDSVRQQESRLQEREKSLDNSRRKLEVHRDNVRAAGSRPGVPQSLRLAGLAVLALGGTGCVLSALKGDFVMAAIAGAVGLLGLLVALAPGASSARRRDPAVEQLEAEIRTSESAFAMAQTEWTAILRHLGLSPTLSPEAKDETLRGIEDAARDLKRVDEHAARITRLEETASSIDGLYAQVAKEVDEPPQGADVAANIETLETRLAAARAEKVKQESLGEQVQQLSEEVKGLQGQQEKGNTGLSGFLASHGAPSPEALQEKYRRSAAARDLRKSIDASLRTIEATVGAGDTRKAFIEELKSTTPEDIRAALAGLKERVTALETEMGETNRKVGALDNELQALVSNEDLVDQEAKVETLTQQLQDAYREWLTARIALWGIGAAVSRYEAERQPDVIREAQNAFVSMTSGRYEKLLKPLDSDELHVRDVNGADRTVDELSRGTREQLYLAMRLGLIAQYEQNAEPLPVIMDDILVNFDDDRGPLAVQALAEFAKDRQVIVMTCHQNTLELYRQAGASKVTLERDTALL